MVESVKLTGYKAGPDNAYKGHPNGGTDTASGVKLNPKYATCAIPMEKGRTNLQVGDVILVENTDAAGKVHKAAVWVTDVGGLPHGDIDLAESPEMQRQLGIEFKESANGKSVTGLTGAHNVKVTKLASVKPGGLKNPDAVNEGIVQLNKKLENADSFKDNDAIRAELAAQVKDPANLALADKEHENVIYKAPSKGGYRDRKEGESFRDDEEYAGYLKDLMATNPMLGMFLLIIGLLTGMVTMDQVGDLLKSGTKDKSFGEGYTDGGLSADTSRINKKGVLGGKVEGLDKLETPRYNGQENAGRYFADSAKTFENIHEGPNNSGPFVKWVLANAGCGEGNPWCAGFASKIYEGTGLFNYTASALNFGEQGLATDSYRQGVGKLDGISIGDPIVFQRGAASEHHGHVGIVVDVVKENGKVVKVKTMEGNSGSGAVLAHEYTPEKLQNSHYLGYVDIKDRETKLGLDIKKQLSTEYSVSAPEKEPGKTAPAPVIEAKKEDVPATPKPEVKEEVKKTTSSTNSAEEAAKAAALDHVRALQSQGVIVADSKEREHKQEEKKTAELLASCQIDAVIKNKDGYPPKPRADVQENTAAKPQAMLS